MSIEPLRPALSDLVHRYAALADQRRIGELADLFLPEGVLVLPEPPDRLDAHVERHGRAAIAAHMQVLDQVPVTAHELVGEVFDLLAEDRAHGRVACVAHHVAQGRDAIWHLHYDDDYQRLDGVWRFARRELHVDFITTAKVARSRV